MGFEITYGDISKTHFRSGLGKILNTETKDFKVAYNMGRVGDLLDQEHRAAKRAFEKLARSHGVLDENGIMKVTEENEAAWEKAYDEFKAHSVKVERHKIRLEDVKDISLSPLEITALEPILDGMERFNH